MVILHSRAGHQANPGVQPMWDFNPTKDAHQRTPAGGGTRRYQLSPYVQLLLIGAFSCCSL